MTKEEIKSMLDIEDTELRDKMFMMKVKKYSMYGLGQFDIQHIKFVHELLQTQQEWFKMYLDSIRDKEGEIK